MFRIILAILAGMVLAAITHGDVQRVFAAGPSDPWADDSPCDPGARYAPGVMVFQYEAGLCSEAEVYTAEALNAVIQEEWRKVNPHVRSSDFPCTVYNEADNWVYYLNSQGVFIGSPATWNVWTTFGGLVVCPPSQRIGKDPVTQLAAATGRNVGDVLTDILAKTTARAGPEVDAAALFLRLYPGSVEGFNPKRPTCSHTAVDTNPLSPGFGKDACAFFNW